MRALMNVLGILLVVFGIAVLVYKGFSYQENSTIAKLGEVEVTATTEKHVYLSPVYGGIALLAGGALLFAVNRKRK